MTEINQPRLLEAQTAESVGKRHQVKVPSVSLNLTGKTPSSEPTAHLCACALCNISGLFMQTSFRLYWLFFFFNLYHQKRDSYPIQLIGTKWNVSCLEMLLSNPNCSHHWLFVLVVAATQTSSNQPQSQAQECTVCWKSPDWLWKSRRPPGIEQEGRHIWKDLLPPNPQGWNVSAFNLETERMSTQVIEANIWSTPHITPWANPFKF